MGLSTAYWLAGASLRITLVEARHVGFGASGRNAGLMLAGTSQLEAPQHLLSVLSREQIDAEYRQTGHLALAASDEMLDRMHAEAAARSPDAPSLSVLDRAACEELLHTRIADGLLGGRWYPAGAVVHPSRLLRGLATAAALRGAHIAETTVVHGIRTRRGVDFADVETSRGRITARHVVVAANAATRTLVPGLSTSFRPQRGQMLATRPVRHVFGPAMAIDWGTVYWRQTTTGAIVLGGCSHVDAAAERTSRARVNPRIQAALSNVLNGAFPDLPPLRIARRWAGIMDQTLDGRAIVGPSSAGSTQWVVAGFGGHGLPPAIAVGREVAAGVLAGEVPPTLDRFDPRRFAPPHRHVRVALEAS